MGEKFYIKQNTSAEEMMAAEQERKVTRVKKVQRGFSEYQAAWIVDQ